MYFGFYLLAQSSYYSRSQNRQHHRYFGNSTPPPLPESYPPEHDKLFGQSKNRVSNSHHNYQPYHNNKYNDQRGYGDRQRDRKENGRSSSGSGTNHHKEHRSRRRH